MHDELSPFLSRDIILPSRDQIMESALEDMKNLVRDLKPGEILEIERHEDSAASIFTVTRIRPVDVVDE
jgi:hypothetical protein